MTNDDLKRFYPQNAKPERDDDFVRYDKLGNVVVGNAVNAKDAVNLETLIKHAGGPGADLNYKGVWTAGDEVKQYDIVYIDTNKSRIFYMCVVDIDNSNVSPDLDEEHYVEYLETPIDFATIADIEAAIGNVATLLGNTNDLEV